MKALTRSETILRTPKSRITAHDSNLPQPSRGLLANAKPFTVAELQARSHGENYFQLAHTYRDSHDTLNAVSCCLEGLALTFGISRPLAVRDQLHDLLDNLDPLATVSSAIKLCMDSMSLERDENVITASQTRRPAPTNLETPESAPTSSYLPFRVSPFQPRLRGCSCLS